MRLGWNRLSSLCAYLGGAAIIASARGAPLALLFAMTEALVMIFIWFPDRFGDWLGPFPMPQGMNAKVIDRESPGWLVAAFGWIILLGVFGLYFCA